MVSEFTANVVKIIKNIPKGKVISYGRIAALAGDPHGARQVTRAIHTQSKKHKLPWHRVVNSQGRISIKDPVWSEEQRFRLEAEGVEFSSNGTIDLDRFLWDIGSVEELGKSTKKS